MKLCEKERCTGCMACYNICRQRAITMQPDEEGFLYPCVDESKCADCGMCEYVCPQLIHSETFPKQEKLVLAAWQKSKKILKNSTSGGAFSAFAGEILKHSGVVYGVGFNSELKVIHKRITNIESLSELRGSKYVQSEIGNTFQQAKTDLEAGSLVLFSGTPCQIDALYRYLGERYIGQLFTIDLVCHGVPSPWVFSKYLSYLSSKYGSKVRKVFFRDKNPGWYVFGMKVEFENGQIYQKDTYHDPYIRGFLREYFLRPSCHCCLYTNTSRPADITLADDWGYQETNFRDRDNDQGISMIMINSKNGENLFGLARRSLNVFPRTIENAVNANQALRAVFPPNEHRKEFWNDFRNNSFEFVVEKYLYEESIPEWTLTRRKNIQARRQAMVRDKIVHFPNHVMVALLGKSNYEKLKYKLKKRS